MDIAATVSTSPKTDTATDHWRAIAAILLITLWTCVVRLPFFHIVNDDEAFFSVLATRWLHGELPYAASFDVKPPLLFAIFALAQAVFGASLATIKGLEILFTAAGAVLLYRMLDQQGSKPTACWAALLFPVYSLALSGVNGANSVLQLPFIIAAFSCLMAALATEQRRLRRLFLCGVAIGAAGMVKQTSIFEAVAIACLLLWYWRRDHPASKLAMLVAGALLPLALGALYFLVAGHFSEAVQAVVGSALARVDVDLPGDRSNALIRLFRLIPLIAPLYGLVLCSAIALVRQPKIAPAFAGPMLPVATVWLISAVAGIVAMHSLFAYYAATLIAPLLILSGALVLHGLDFAAKWRKLAIALYAVAAVATPLFADRQNLIVAGPNGPDDFAAEQASGAKLLELGAVGADPILVLGRGLFAYVFSGTTPATRYFHNLQLLCDFPTPDADPLGIAFRTRPRFVLLSDPRFTRACVREDRLAEIRQHLDADYTLKAVTHGVWDGTYIYELNRP